MKEFLHRADDYCFRLGGEEFGILIKSKSKENSINFANRFRRRVESEKIPHKLNSVSKYVTVSIGVNHIFAKNIQNPDIFYKQSDDLLYEAKEFGRNQIRHN
jgi:diguanylate cyclase (GGDEF)-like protein